MDYLNKMVIKKFEDIIAWQKGQDLAVEIYREFGGITDFRFRDQITSAVVSISNNIAEGFERESNADFKRFLNFSLGSCSECKSMLYLAQRLNYISNETGERLRNSSIEISKIINGLKKSLTTVN